MKKHVLRQLRAVQKFTSTTDMAGRLRISVNGSLDEHDQLLLDLKNEGWIVYRQYVEIGNVLVEIDLN